ncbi:hypothetical protein T4E_4895 [Trichinella pseudospiralis]|uniref:Uncharacterized protein n=1 Tax=Trichinella pseudospiralis TaxID=6337 RepID=A0A0V0YKL7_TRIPS|nr:hypothetical protein T4E_4895 [Trichinella pseudospiralis]
MIFPVALVTLHSRDGCSTFPIRLLTSFGLPNPKMPFTLGTVIFCLKTPTMPVVVSLQQLMT